jgi:hypothetical protein
VYAKGYTSRGATRFCPVPPHCTIYIYIYINATPKTPGVYLGLFADDTCTYATDRSEGFVLRKLQRGLGAIETHERWNIKINKEKALGHLLFSKTRPLEAHLTLNGWNTPFANHVKYLGVILDKRIVWRLHIDMIEAKAFRTFIRIYSLFKSERLSASIKVTLHKAKPDRKYKWLKPGGGQAYDRSSD